MTENNIESKIENNLEYKNLVISGGGFNGYQFFGIIKYLDENNLLNKIDKYVGVSMGAFINLLIIIDYKYLEIDKFLIKFDFNKIFDLKFEKILLDENLKGFSNGDNFSKLIKKFLVNKNLDENITLKELYEKTKKKLIIGTTNLTQDKYELINHENYPDMPVYIALRMTSCIPLFFEPIEYNNNFYVDGVIKDNFPIQIIPDEEIKNTIGIVLQTKSNIYDIKGMTSLNYIIHLYRAIVNEPMHKKILKYKELCKLFIVEPKMNSFNYTVNEMFREELINSGYEYCKNYFLNN
jgi:NTE family protein